MINEPRQIIISNSETQDFQKCERLWYYKYFLQLSPTGNITGPLAYGVYGHEWLYMYYRTIANGGNLAEAMIEANKVFRRLQKERLVSDEFVMHLTGIMWKYVTNHPVIHMDVIAVEQRLKAHLFYDPIKNIDVYIGMTMDLLTRGTEGKYAGQEVLIDHKFKNNFIKAEAAQMNTQLPKYIYVLRQNGYNVNVALFNQLRYRQMDDETIDPKTGKPKHQRFLRLSIEPSEIEIKEIIDDHIKLSKRIVELRSDPDYVSTNVTRNMDSSWDGCENCTFFGMCNAQLKGKNHEATQIVKAHFKVGNNSYLDSYQDLLNE